MTFQFSKECRIQIGDQQLIFSDVQIEWNKEPENLSLPQDILIFPTCGKEDPKLLSLTGIQEVMDCTLAIHFNDSNLPCGEGYLLYSEVSLLGPIWSQSRSNGKGEFIPPIQFELRAPKGAKSRFKYLGASTTKTVYPNQPESLLSKMSWWVVRSMFDFFLFLDKKFNGNTKNRSDRFYL